MEAQLTQLINKGMNQDASISKASNEFAYKNYNIRITSVEDNTLLSVTNEKGPLKLSVKIKDLNGSYLDKIEGKLLGYSILNDTIVLFTKIINNSNYTIEEDIPNIEFVDNNTDSSLIIQPIQSKINYDCIYKLEINNNSINGELLFKGDLNFAEDTILETLPFYESEKSQKIYWVDGVNIPRFINLTDTKKYSISNHFDFIPSVDSILEVSITKEYNSVGVFPAGVIQYFITYYNKYGAETGIIYSSDLLYITSKDSGLDGETNSTCNFKLSISNIDNNFDYLKIYSVLRTSEDATPVIKVINELNISEIEKASTITIIDDNKQGYSESIANLLALQKSFFSAKTLINKDNVLFMGNIYIESNKVNDAVAKYINDELKKNSTSDSPFVEFIEKGVGNKHIFSLQKSERMLKTFKCGEIYRFGIQFLDKYANWTEPIWLGDKTCDIRPYITDNGLYVASQVKTKFSEHEQLTWLISQHYIKQRLLIANPTLNDRSILAQGIVLPTVFNFKDRINNNTFAYQSWISRPRGGFMRYNHLDGLGSDFEDNNPPQYDEKTEIQNAVNYAPIDTTITKKAYVISIADYHRVGFLDENKGIFVHIYEYDGFIQSKKVTDIDINKLKLINGIDKDNPTNSNYILINDIDNIDTLIQGSITLDGKSYTNNPLTNFNELKNSKNICFNKIKAEITKYTNSSITNGLTVDTLIKYIKDVGKGKYLKRAVTISGTGGNWYSIGFQNIGFIRNSNNDIKPYFNPENVYKHYNRKPKLHCRYLSTYIEVDSSTDVNIIEESQQNNFYIDESIVTFHSPELQEVRHLIDNQELTLKIIGVADKVSTKFDMSLQTDPAGLLSNSGLKEDYDKSLNKPTEFLYTDAGYESNYINKELIADYPLYMWNKKDSITGISVGDIIYKGTSESENQYADKAYSSLKNKIMCWYQESKHIINFKGIDIKANTYDITPRIFDSDEPTAVTFNYNKETKVYQGNLDTINNTRSIKKDSKSYGYSLFYKDINKPNEIQVRQGNQYAPVQIKYKTTEHAVFTLRKNNKIYLLPGERYKDLDDSNNTVINLWKLWDNYDYSKHNIKVDKEYTKDKRGNSLQFTVYSIKYRYFWFNEFYRLREPVQIESESKIDEFLDNFTFDNMEEYDSSDEMSYVQALFPYNDVTSPYYFIAELSRNIPYTKLYGGTSDEALKQIKWIPASLEEPILNEYGKYQPISTSYGDTYFQNYEYLMSYPYTEEDQNSIINIVSFPCETHINVQGRYDKRYEEFNLLGARKTNFPLRNPIYSQKNNLFTYSILDEKFASQRYNNQIISSNKKGVEEKIDTWTKISPASAIVTDGSYGEITKLIKLNNTLLSFQEKAISTINFNDRTALTSTSNIQVVLGNSEKIEGISLIDNSIGCQNKLSICVTNSGIYFIDNYKKALFRINKEGIQNISGNGLNLWFKDNIKGNEVLSYDSVLGDIYIANNEHCIIYNENLNSFTSFMDYQNLRWMFNIKGETYSLWDNNIDKFAFYKMFAGDYNTTFEENKYNGYEVVYKVNPEPHLDKIFSNVEYIADCYPQDSKVDNSNILISENPFDKLEVWNEYQRGITTSFKRGQYPNFAKKFRIWRVDVPRDSTYKRDRIRNPWMIMSLSKNPDKPYKMVLHDLLVKYYK